MSKTPKSATLVPLRRNLSRIAGILTAACCLAVLAAPTPAAAEANWRIFGSLTDTDDLAEAFGGGIRVGFPFKETWEFDVSVAYYEDFKNRWEDNSENRINVELSYIPTDFGFTWTKDGASGFQFGFGLTWGYLDINDLEIEGMYRILDASVENLTIGNLPTASGSDELKMGGYTINLGYRF